MTKRYTGGVISSSLPTVNSAGASGVFLLSQQADAQSRNAWPPYKIEESLRFRSSASASLSRTPASAGNRRTWTWSGWVKRGSFGSWQIFFSAWDGTGGNDTTRLDLSFEAAETISITGGVTVFRNSTQVFRDPAAWYHIVVVADTTNATAQNRLRIYVNGVEITNWSTNNTVTQNTSLAINNNASHVIGARGNSPTQYFDGYMSEVYLIDGQALTPSAFGATDKDGNWSPIAYTGTYGTNGFYVNFRDNTSATTMGYDYSGNGNNWTLNGFNVSTANTTYDIMFDVPEDQDGANARSNYCTFNPLSTSSRVTVSDGNLRIAKDSFADWNTSLSSFLLSSGKWYWEFTLGTTTNVYFEPGYVSPGFNYSSDSFYPGRTSNSYAIDANTGNKRTNDTTASYGSTYASNDVVMLAIDLDTKQIWFGKNGQWGNGSGSFNQTFANSTVAFSSIATPLIPAVGMYTSENGVANFGQRPFTYTPPSGFKALNTFNLSDPTIKQPNRQFDATIWTGDNTTPRNISNAGLFQPDFVWLKSRSNAYQHNLYDAVRGAGAAFSLSSDQSAAEGGNSNVYGFLSAFNSTGFQVTQGTAGSGGAPNGNAYGNQTSTTYVGWQWNAGGSTVTNTAGSISAQVRANPTAGFSIVTYTGNNTASTVGHGLGVAPKMIIVKVRSTTGAWGVYHESITASRVLYLNVTDRDDGSVIWNSTTPTSSVFSIGAHPTSNPSGQTLVAYCFAEIPGYSAFGSYTGNGSTDGSFIHTGFRPRFILMKSSTAAEQWSMWDSSRIGYNPVNYFLGAQSSAAEDTTPAGSNSNGGPDFLSNGFKMRSTGGSSNTSGGTYIYMAFAEAPFKYARSR
jgi:hypothetical protein